MIVVVSVNVRDRFLGVFFFNDTATTEIYTLSLHDALPIFGVERVGETGGAGGLGRSPRARPEDRKSTRLNSSHRTTSNAVFCMKKKKSASACASMNKRHQTIITPSSTNSTP